MCGIAGGIGYRNFPTPVDRDVVRRLNQHQRRRGPDGEGLWTSPDKSIVFGHRRLAIIDVGNTGAQPMTDATGRWTVTFNGEIYNYREVRRQLEDAGRRFLTQSDTEVLINCVAEWGEQGLRKLRGMYAFGLWDEEEKELWLARDPFGIKPLYWASSGSTLWFASQARALAECAPVNTARNPAGLVGFYLWGAVPEPFTWWEGIHAVPAGHLLRVVQGRDIPPATAFLRVEDAYSAASAQPISQIDMKAALVDSIRHHFVADVTVGVFLSAGVDSTVIATLAKEAGFKLQTVTLAFDEFKSTSRDEAPMAEETARHLGSDHRTVHVSRAEFLGWYDDFMSAMDQPTTDGLNTYLVSKAAAAAGLKVVLSGLGGDELFGGYPSFRQVPWLTAFGRKIPWRAAVGAVVSSIGSPICQLLNASPKLMAMISYSGDIESAYYLRRCLHLFEELELLTDDTWSRPGLERLASLLPGGDAVRAAKLAGRSFHGAVSQLEISNYMRNQPLRDTDWASMAHSIEVRVPFLDLPLLAKLAPAINSNKPPCKAELANCAGPIGDRVMARSKTGFSTPIVGWLTGVNATRHGLRPWAGQIAMSFRHVPTAAFSPSISG
jgi:asparagine synthase (glutamine-hydrolysing)